MSDICRINILATGCAELRRWVPTLTATGITEAMLEAAAKFDYATQPGQCADRLCVTHRVEAKLGISGGR